MASKQLRHQTIQKLIRSKAVSTQAQLRNALRHLNIDVNQATLSRDLAELDIRKQGGRYVVAGQAERWGTEIDLSSAVRGFTTCGPHLILIQTPVGQAMAVAVVIDASEEACFAGTLAGDDCIFVATRNRRTQSVALRRLKQWFGDKHVK